MACLTQGEGKVEGGASKLNAAASGILATSQRTLLLRMKKEVRDMDDGLELTKKECEHRARACGERYARLRRREGVVRGQVVRFERFVRENDAKFHRAETKATTERQVVEGSRFQRRVLAARLTKLEEQLAASDTRLSQLVHFKDYLSRTADSSNHEYPEIADLLTRLKTLQDANGDLAELIERRRAEMDALRSELEGLRVATQSRLLALNSEIGASRKILDARRCWNTDAGELRERQQESANEVAREMWHVAVGIQNLYERASAAMKPRLPTIWRDRFGDDSAVPQDPVGFEKTLEAGLTAIRERIVDLADIVENGRAVCHASSSHQGW